MVFRIRRRKPKDVALRSIENTKPTKATKALVGPEATTRNFVKAALNGNAAQHPKAKSAIRGIFKRTNKKRKNGKKFIFGLNKDDPISLRAETSHETGSSASGPIDHTGKTSLFTSRPPLPPSSVQHIRYRHEYNRPPLDEASTKGSVVSDDSNSIYKLMLQELKQDFSEAKHAPLRFVPAQTVVHSNKTREEKEYHKDIDDTLRVLDDEPGNSQQEESRDSSNHTPRRQPLSDIRQPLSDIDETREDFVGSNDPNTADEGAINMSLSSDIDGNMKPVGSLRHASQEDRHEFDAQLNCASDDPQADSSERSVGSRSARSIRSARSAISARSGRSARSSKSARSDRSSLGDRSSELVSLRELRGKRRHRKQKSEVSTEASSSSYDGNESTRRKQRLKKLPKRERVPVDNRSYNSEASGTFDDYTTLGDTEYEWDNIDSFDSWLSLEHELRAGAKDDWFCGVCFR
ncbi:unnamed protein product [Cylindrotheca closterium]|uniref:Uncharacterized protein n=1 Tax=Cylindrotheca closterium TaxID=2856 RepID=A0AAD2CNC2_9STRA|nr:unnamed protein product [Cylindrotheca closterium]